MIVIGWDFNRRKYLKGLAGFYIQSELLEAILRRISKQAVGLLLCFKCAIIFFRHPAIQNFLFVFYSIKKKNRFSYG